MFDRRSFVLGLQNKIKQEKVYIPEPKNSENVNENYFIDSNTIQSKSSVSKLIKTNTDKQRRIVEELQDLVKKFGNPQTNKIESINTQTTILSEGVTRDNSNSYFVRFLKSNQNSQFNIDESMEAAREAYKLRMQHLENIANAIIADRKAGVPNTITSKDTHDPSQLRKHLMGLEKSGMSGHEIGELTAEARKRLKQHPRYDGPLRKAREAYHNLDKTGNQLDVKG